MTKVTMPEPTEQANLAEYIMGKRYFTSAQMNAYAAARVREALESAAWIVDDEADNAREERYHPGLVGALECCASDIRALIPQP